MINVEVKVERPALSGSTLAERQPGRGRPSPFYALRYRDFRLLWIGLVVSNVGTWMQMIAQSWLVYELTSSPLYLGLVGLCQAVPRLLFSLLGGAVADRFDRKHILYFTQTSSMLLALALGMLAETGAIRVWHILASAFLNSLVMSFDQPTRQALVSDLVPVSDLANAIAINSMAFNGAAVFGPSLGGLVLAAVGAGGCFLINGLSFLAVIIALGFMHIPSHENSGIQGGSAFKGRSLRQDMGEVFVAVRQDHMLSALLLLTAVLSFCARPYNQLMPVFARDILKVGPRGLGLLMMAPGVGTVIGSLTLATLGGSHRLGPITVGAILTFSFTLLGFSCLPYFVPDLVLLIITGMGQTISLASLNTLLQTHSQSQMRGRIMGMYTMLNTGLNPLGALPAGALAARFGAPLVVGSGAMIVTAATILIAWRWVPELFQA